MKNRAISRMISKKDQSLMMKHSTVSDSALSVFYQFQVCKVEEERRTRRVV